MYIGVFKLRTWGYGRVWEFLSPEIEIFPHESPSDDGSWIVVRIKGLETNNIEDSNIIIENCKNAMENVLNEKVDVYVRRFGENIIIDATLKSFVRTKNREILNALIKAIFAEISNMMIEIPTEIVKVKVWGWKKITIPSLHGYDETYIFSVLNSFFIRAKAKIRREPFPI